MYMYLLYPTVHFQNLGRIVQGLAIFLGIKTLCHSLLVILAFDFPSAKKVIATSAQDGRVVTWEGERILWNPKIWTLNALANINFRPMNILPLVVKPMLKEESYTYNWRILFYWLGSKLWHRKFHLWRRCRLFWHQLRSHSAKSTPLVFVTASYDRKVIWVNYRLLEGFLSTIIMICIIYRTNRFGGPLWYSCFWYQSKWILYWLEY